MVLHIEDWFETSAFSNHLQQFIQVYFSSPQNKGKSFEIKAFTVKNLITGTPVVDWRKVSDTYVHLKEANIQILPGWISQFGNPNIEPFTRS